MMTRTVGSLVMTGLLMLIMLVQAPRARAHGDLTLPELPAPESYGDVLIDRFTSEKKYTAVVFSHWAHRANYTCRVCHSELDIMMKANETGIECDNGRMSGKYCAVCHDGKTAFGPKGKDGDNCGLCHNADKSADSKKFGELKSRLPASKFGDEIDWVKALEEGRIKPKRSLKASPDLLNHESSFALQAEMTGIPPAVFSHKTHVAWLDCNNCHPEIFNIKKKATKHFSMSRILNSEFCGVCHLRIAFPLNECRRCHPGMKK